VRQRSGHDPAGGPLAAAHRAHRHHRDHHRQVLHDQESHRDAAVQRLQLALVREQLHDDDRARERQRHGDVQRREPVLAERQRQHEAERDGEAELPEPRGERHRPDVAHVLQVELESHREQEHRDADLRQQVDLVVRSHDPEDRRTRQDPDHDECHQQRLAEADRDAPGERGQPEEQREFREGRLEQGVQVGQLGHARREEGARTPFKIRQWRAPHAPGILRGYPDRRPR
jgi:hypothetical protein